MVPLRDAELVQIVTSELADATARARKADGSSWLACRPGCTPCCHGVFKISMLDAERLRLALAQMGNEDPGRANSIRTRAEHFISDFSNRFPGEINTGLLGADEDAWEAFANLPETDVPCPALEPVTGVCELYSARPMTCRVFGPPIVAGSGIGLCELCYVDADRPTIIAGQLHLSHITLEQELDSEMPAGETVIAWALATDSVPTAEPQMGALHL